MLKREAHEILEVEDDDLATVSDATYDLCEFLLLLHELGVIELDADCCGIAGTYGLKKEKYEISMAVGERLFGQLREAHADVAACDSETCRWQIEHAVNLHAVHPVELLHRAYGLRAP